MNHTMLIVDRDRKYAGRLSDYLNNKSGFPFLVRAVEDIEQLDIDTKDQVEIILCSTAVIEKDSVRSYGTDIIELIGEDDTGVTNRTIFKYQSCESIAREILHYVSTMEYKSGLVTRKKSMKLIGIYSPVGRCGKTHLAIAMGQVLAEHARSLYINLEPFSGVPFLLHTEDIGDLADVIYTVNTDSSTLDSLLGSLVVERSGLDIAPPMGNHKDLASITLQEWKNLLRAIEQRTDYEYVIVDMSGVVQGMCELLAVCDYVYVPRLNQGLCNAKYEQFMSELKLIGQSSLADRVITCEVPLLTQYTDMQRIATTGIGTLARKLIDEW